MTEASFAAGCVTSEFVLLTTEVKRGSEGYGRGNSPEGSVATLLVLVDCAEEGGSIGRGH